MDAREQLAKLGELRNAHKFLAMLGVCAAVIAAGVAIDINDVNNKLSELVTAEAELKTTFMDKKKSAVNLDAHKKQLKEIETAFGTLLQQLPNKSEIDALLNDINQAGVSRGLVFKTFRPNAEIKTEFYAEIPVAIEFTGQFHDLGAFAEDISKFSRIVNLERLVISSTGAAPTPGGQSNLNIQGIARTYRYLNADDAKKEKAK